MSITETSVRPAGAEPYLKPVAVTIRQAQTLLAGKSRSEIYVCFAERKLDALRDGKRTLVTMESIERLMASLPRAEFKPLGIHRPRRRVSLPAFHLNNSSSPPLRKKRRRKTA